MYINDLLNWIDGKIEEIKQLIDSGQTTINEDMNLFARLDILREVKEKIESE